jgi:hypothetical protein
MDQLDDDAIRVVRSDDIAGGAPPADGVDARRRRRVLSGRVAAGLAVLIAVGAMYAIPALQRQPATAAPTPSPLPSTLSAPAVLAPTAEPTFTTGELGLSVLSGNDIVPVDGTRFTVGLPAGYRASGATRIPDGWLVEAHPETGSSVLFFVRGVRAPVRVGTLRGAYAVSPDGRTVVTDGTAAGSLQAYALPTLTRGRTATFRAGMRPVVRGLTDTWALVMDASGDGGATKAYAWNLRSGSVVATDKPVVLWGMSDQGAVLRGMYPQPGAPPGCADLVPIGQLSTVRPTGACSNDLAPDSVYAQISPAGTWALVMPRKSAPTLVRTADLAAGRWQPESVGLRVGDQIGFWVTDEAFVSRSGPGGFTYCQVQQLCSYIAVPAGLTDPNLIPNRGWHRP